MTFGQKIQTLRKKTHMSQDDLAEKLCVSRQALSKWENNLTNPDIDKVLLMSKVFSVSTDYLLKDEMTSSENLQTSISSKSLFLTPQNVLLVSTLIIIIGALISIGAMADGVLYVFWRTSNAIPGFAIQLVGMAIFMIIHNTLMIEKEWTYKFMLTNVWFLSIIPHLLYGNSFITAFHVIPRFANIPFIVLQSFHLLFAINVNWFISLFIFIRMKKTESMKQLNS
jgi:transcriptional regulator with XRE-family HTH domain